MHQKRAAAIHDISCFGKCSLTVALPILSAANVSAPVIPTAVLSTHTGGFDGFTYRDLTDDIAPITRHWKSLDLKFDAVYSGFLGSAEQIKLVCDFLDAFDKDGCLTLIDPAMADNGKMYTVFDISFAEKMKTLCARADIIVPNITEACFMLGIPYREGPYEREFIESLLRGLHDKLGTEKIVLTGVYHDSEQLGAACYDAVTDTIGYAFNEKIDGMYHGTGDVFASALLGALLNDFTLLESSQIAVDFTLGCIKRTKAEGTDVRFGVNFEAGLPEYIEKLGLFKKETT